MTYRIFALLLLVMLIVMPFGCSNDDDDDDDDNDTTPDDDDDNDDDDNDDDDCIECENFSDCEYLGWEWFCNEFGCCEYDDMVDKPNIYLYPEHTMDVSVRLVFKQGSSLAWSWPLYGDGWDVSVTPDGLIDDLYPYLFYEAHGANVYQFERGAIVPGAGLFDWFEDYLLALGFSGREVGDFLLYWTHELPEYPLFAVYPQSGEIIDDSIGLDVSPAPDTLFRIWFVIHGLAEDDEMPIVADPDFSPFVREGFTVVEWGLVTAFL